MAKWSLLLVLLVIAGSTFAQDDDACSFESIQAYMDARIEAYQAQDAADAGAALDDARTLHADIGSILDSCGSQVASRLTLDNTGIPLNSWVVVSAPPKHDAVQTQAERYDVDGTCLYGFLYIDHEVGVTLQIESFCDRPASGVITPTAGPNDDQSRVMLRYDTFDGLEFSEMTADQREALDLPAEPDWLETYLDDEIEVTRGIRRLDALRFPGFPDDIEALLVPEAEDGEIEQVFCRLKRQVEEEIFECELLNEPYQEFGVSSGELLVVQLAEYEGQLYAIVTGSALNPSSRSR